MLSVVTKFLSMASLSSSSPIHISCCLYCVLCTAFMFTVVTRFLSMASLSSSPVPLSCYTVSVFIVVTCYKVPVYGCCILYQCFLLLQGSCLWLLYYISISMLSIVIRFLSMAVVLYLCYLLFQGSCLWLLYCIYVIYCYKVPVYDCCTVLYLCYLLLPGSCLWLLYCIYVICCYQVPVYGCCTVSMLSVVTRFLSMASLPSTSLYFLCHIINHQEPSREQTSKWFVHHQEYSG